MLRFKGLQGFEGSRPGRRAWEVAGYLQEGRGEPCGHESPMKSLWDPYSEPGPGEAPWLCTQGHRVGALGIQKASSFRQSRPQPWWLTTALFLSNLFPHLQKWGQPASPASQV